MKLRLGILAVFVCFIFATGAVGENNFPNDMNSNNENPIILKNVTSTQGFGGSWERNFGSHCCTNPGIEVCSPCNFSYKE